MRIILLCGAAVLFAGPAYGQVQGRMERDHRFVAELGATAHRSWSGGPTLAGPAAALETAPFDHGLEVETGFEWTSGGGTHESSVDVLAMKSWPIARGAELMIGLGPELSWSGGETSLAAETVAHLMLWPTPDLGLFIEPGISIEPKRGGERSFGLSAGVLLGIP